MKKCEVCKKEKSVALIMLDDKQFHIGLNCMIIKSKNLCYGSLDRYIPKYKCPSYSFMRPLSIIKDKFDYELETFCRYVFIKSSKWIHVKVDNYSFVFALEPYRVNRIILGAKKVSVRVYGEPKAYDDFELFAFDELDETCD